MSILASAVGATPAPGMPTARPLTTGARAPGREPSIPAPVGVVQAGDDPVESPTPLTVMTFNIRTSSGNDGDNGWSHRRALVAATMRPTPHAANVSR